MMKNADMAKALHGLAKKGIIENHQERDLLRSAANRITCLDAEIRDLRAKMETMNQLVFELEDDGK